MKRVIAILTVILLLCPIAVLAQGQAVVDGTGVLTDEQCRDLQQQAEALRTEYGCGVYMAIVEDYTVYGADTDSAAWQFYQAQNWEQNGIFLMLSLAERDYYVLAAGEHAMQVFTLRQTERMADEFLGALADNDWNGGMQAYLQAARWRLERGIAPREAALSPGKIAAIILVPLLIALIVCLVFLGQMKTARKGTLAREYMKIDESSLTIRQDIFTHCTRVVRKIETQNHSGGGGGGGGSSHHGSGGKF